MYTIQEILKWNKNENNWYINPADETIRIKIGDGAEIGDEAEIGDGAEIGNGAKIGNWCGVKKSESSWYKRLDKLLTSICDLIRERG